MEKGLIKGKGGEDGCLCIIDRQVSAAYSCTFPNTLSSPPHQLLTKDLKKTFPPPSTNILYHFIEQEHWLNTSLSHKPNLTLTIWLTSFFERIWPNRLYIPFCLLLGSKRCILLHCFVVLIFFVSFCKFDQNWTDFIFWMFWQNLSQICWWVKRISLKHQISIPCLAKIKMVLWFKNKQKIISCTWMCISAWERTSRDVC